MIPLILSRAERVLAVGAHCDDIEIGCGGTILQALEANAALEVCWVIFASDDKRREEAERSADRFLASASGRHVEIRAFRESYFPSIATEIKEYFEDLAKRFRPDVIFTHFRGDRHQDHRIIGDLTWNTFRDQVILEYEIPKWDGDLGAPNVFVPLDAGTCERKMEILMSCFESQRGRDWFTEETFYALMRLRGIECRSPSMYAEAFYASKLVLGGLGMG